ncbi:MAG: hypothetical protein RL038_1159 [Actinomycetota bacterium]
MAISKIAFAALTITTIALPSFAVPTAIVEVPQINIQRFEKRTSSSWLPNDTSYTVVDTFDSETLTSKSGTEPQLPASVMKLVTAVVALESFGHEHQLHTEVTLNGRDLVLVGGADPILTESKLRTLAKKTSKLIDLNKSYKLKIDTSLFTSHTDPKGWLNSYVPGEVRPVTALSIYGSDSKSPAKEAAQYFVSALREQGVEVYFAGAGASTGAALTTVKSLRMAKLVKEMLEYSNNNTAETLFHLAGTKLGSGSWVTARKQSLGVLKSLNVNINNWKLVDGSGLSRSNRLTTKGLTELLLKILNPNHPDLNKIVELGLLPKGGKEGTLKLRFKEQRSKCAGELVEAKTGTLSDTVGLAGYVKTVDGGLAAFAVLANNLPSRSWQSPVRSRIDYMVTGLSGCDLAAR